MATGSWVTTDEEDVAIAAIAKETASEFVARHLQHQLRFVVDAHRQQAKATIAEKYEALPPDEKAAVDELLERRRAEGDLKR